MFTSKLFHVSDRHPQYGKLIGLAGQRAASGHHIGQFGDVRGHLVASSAFYLAMILPTVGS